MTDAIILHGQSQRDFAKLAIDNAQAGSVVTVKDAIRVGIESIATQFYEVCKLEF